MQPAVVYDRLPEFGSSHARDLVVLLRDVEAGHPEAAKAAEFRDLKRQVLAWARAQYVPLDAAALDDLPEGVPPASDSHDPSPRS